MKPLSRPGVDTDVLLRALAIAWVVFNHARSSDGLGGGMTVLLMLSGFNFAKFGLRAADLAGARRALFRLGLKILVPSCLLVVAAQLYERKLDVGELLFVNNWFTVEHVAHFPVWYAQVVLQMFALLWVLFSIPLASAAFFARPLRASIVLLLAALALRVGLPLAWDTRALSHHLPQLCLWNFVLGWAIHYATRSELRGLVTRKSLVSALAVFAAFVVWNVPGTLQPWCLSLACLLMLWTERVTLPAPAARAVVIVSQATFAIFLLHREFMLAYRHLPWHPLASGIGCWLFAMLGSIATWLVVAALGRAYRTLPAGREPIPFSRGRASYRRAA